MSSLSPDTHVRGGHRPRGQLGLPGSLRAGAGRTPRCTPAPVTSVQPREEDLPPDTGTKNQTQFSQKEVSGQLPDSSETQLRVCNCYPEAPGREAPPPGALKAGDAKSPKAHRSQLPRPPHRLPAAAPPPRDPRPSPAPSPHRAAAPHPERLRVAEARAQSACASRRRGTQDACASPGC